MTAALWSNTASRTQFEGLGEVKKGPTKTGAFSAENGHSIPLVDSISLSPLGPAPTKVSFHHYNVSESRSYEAMGPRCKPDLAL